MHNISGSAHKYGCTNILYMYIILPVFASHWESKNTSVLSVVWLCWQQWIFYSINTKNVQPYFKQMPQWDGWTDWLNHLYVFRFVDMMPTPTFTHAFLLANFMFPDLCVCTTLCAVFSMGYLKKSYSRLIPLCWASTDDNPSIIILHTLNTFTLMASLVMLASE